MEPKKLREIQKNLEESLKNMTDEQFISLGERFGVRYKKEKEVKSIEYVDCPDNLTFTNEIGDLLNITRLTQANLEAVINKQNEIIDVLNKFLDNRRIR